METKIRLIEQAKFSRVDDARRPVRREACGREEGRKELVGKVEGTEDVLGVCQGYAMGGKTRTNGCKGHIDAFRRERVWRGHDSSTSKVRAW